jgi:50S ribosomal protein L16 3-hydroxylase
VHHHQGRIDARDFDLIKAHVKSLLADDMVLADFAGSYFSKTKCALDLQALDDALEVSDVVDALQNQPLIRTGGLRCFYLDATVAQGVCFVDGERHEFGPTLTQAVTNLCDNDTLTLELLGDALEDAAFATQLTAWVNAGYWYFED